MQAQELFQPDWIGVTEQSQDFATPQLVRALRATLLLPPAPVSDGAIAPLTTHWCLASPVGQRHELLVDGQIAGPGILPPIPLPRRMRAGGTLEFRDRLRVGDTVSKNSCVKSITPKTGSSGQLCFVTIRHDVTTQRGPALSESVDIVYRAAAEGAAKSREPAQPLRQPRFHRLMSSDPVMLFRYSALTFNGHRIHYDRNFATDVEGYPGLVVHGPLQASLLVEQAISWGSDSNIKRFSYRNTMPLFDRETFALNAVENDDGLDLWVSNANGLATMTATAEW
jgi:3-methylfumaryl-CoA hydratase